MRALRSSRRVWGRGSYLAAFSLLGVAEAGVALAIPVSAATFRLDPGFVPAVTLPAPSAPALPTLPALPLPSPTPPTLATPSLPVPTPTLPVPTPTLPVQTPPLPTPPALGGPSPSPSPAATPSPVAPGAGGAGPGSGSGAGNPAGGGWPPHGIKLPLVGITLASPLDAALVAALTTLPLLFGIWVLVFGRTWSEARRSRHAQVRLAIANELGIRPRELTSLDTQALFKLRERAAFDELTGTLRRAAGMAALDREISRARRTKAPLTVAFVDVDGLKEANDRRGHKAGDELLRGLASLLKSGLRGQDLVTRYGGDEFVCVLPDTPVVAARTKLGAIQAEADKTGIRFSIGAAQLERSDDVVSFLARADTEMYEAKARRGEIRHLRPDSATRPDLRSQPHAGA